MKRKVCVVTGTRAEYGLFYPIMKKIRQSNRLELQLVVTTMHLSPEFGNTYQQIEEDGFIIDEKIENLLTADSKSSVAKSTGLATVLLSDTFKRLNPDVILLLGDRFETHAAATTAMLMNIPIAHIHGGEVTEGAVDEQIRHSITKMAYLHFVSTKAYGKRVIQMGEAPERVFCSGAPGIDNILDMQLLEKGELEEALGWNFSTPTALFTYHAETLSAADVKVEIDQILQVLESLNLNVLFTYANADDGGRIINQEIESFAAKNPKKYLVVKSLGQLKYLSAMKHTDLLIGNTSSGIIEAASFKKPVVNIGDRQKGRMRSDNVLDCDIATLEDAVVEALSQVFKAKAEKVLNLYGSGTASDTIVSVLEEQPLNCTKRFYDL